MADDIDVARHAQQQHAGASGVGVSAVSRAQGGSSQDAGRVAQAPGWGRHGQRGNSQHHRRRSNHNDVPPLLARSFKVNRHLPAPAGSSHSQRSGIASSFVRVMSWNLLADALVGEHRRELYPDIPNHVLDGKRRLERSMEHIQECAPHIACFQEVDNFVALHAHLVRIGYACVHVQRTGGKPDGLAIAWHERSVNPVEPVAHLRLRDLNLRDNVAQLCCFDVDVDIDKADHESSPQRRRICVANMHVLFNPKRGDVKLAQVKVVCDALTALSSRLEAPACLAGDFNISPGSPLHEFVIGGVLDVTSVQRKHVAGRIENHASEMEEFENDLPSRATHEPWTAVAVRNGWDDAHALAHAVGGADDGVARHALAPMRSAYAEVGANGMAGEPVWTSAHRRFFGTCDYVFLSGSLVARRVLLPPDPRQLRRGARGSLLPSRGWPSDHVSLVVDLDFV